MMEGLQLHSIYNFLQFTQLSEARNFEAFQIARSAAIWLHAYLVKWCGI